MIPDERVPGGFFPFPLSYYFFLLVGEIRRISNRRREGRVRFTLLPSSCDRYRPRDKRRITGIKQLPRRTATAIPVSMMHSYLSHSLFSRSNSTSLRSTCALHIA